MPEPPPRSQIFGADAERYDRARPGYPAEMIDDLVSAQPRTALDVGCGTGKAGLLLAERDVAVLGIEPDERMAAVARRRGLTVEAGRFEDWEPAGRRFDLVISGQAWHWVDPLVGPGRAADALTPGGALALFWNRPAYDADLRAGLDAAYRAHAPELRSDSVALGTVPLDRTDDDVRVIVGSGRYGPPEVRRYRWSEVYPAALYVEQLQTHSDHLLLAPDRLAALLAAVQQVVERVGGTVSVRYTTTLIRASAG